MLNKGEIETCKEEARNYIEFMETAGDNAGWTRGLLWYVEKLEKRNKELGKGQHSLMQSRRKWKRRYYNLRQRQKEDMNAIKNVFTKEDLDKIVAETRGIQRKAEKYDLLVELLKKDIKKEREFMKGLIHTSMAFHYANGRETKAQEILYFMEEK